MAAKDLGFVGEPDSPEWYAARQWRIGGSDIGAICGWSQFNDRDAIMESKLVVKAPPEKLSKGKARGNRLEAAVLGWMEDKTGAVIDQDTLGHTFVDSERDWMMFNPDALAKLDTVPVIFEAKTTSDRTTEKGWGRAGTVKAPLAYQAQVIWGLGIMGYQKGFIGVLSGATNGRPDLDFALYKISFDKDLFNRLIVKGQEFIDEMNERMDNPWA